MQRIKYTHVLHTGAAHNAAPGRKLSTWNNMLLNPASVMMSWCFPKRMSIGVEWRLSCATIRLLQGKEESKTRCWREDGTNMIFEDSWSPTAVSFSRFSNMWHMLRMECWPQQVIPDPHKPWQAIVWDLGWGWHFTSVYSTRTEPIWRWMFSGASNLWKFLKGLKWWLQNWGNPVEAVKHIPTLRWNPKGLQNWGEI